VKGVLVNPSSSAVLIVHNRHQLDAGTIPSLLSASGVRHALISSREFVQLRPQLAPKHLIILGGPQTATDSADRETLAMLRRIEFYAGRGYSIFGICLGAQILARIFGARIVRHRLGAREIGYHRLSQRDPAMGCDFPPGHYYNWHNDVIEEFTAGRVLLQSELAAVQAFRIASHLVGVQFHPEVDLKTVRYLVANYAHRLNDFGAQSALDQIAAHRRYAQQNRVRLRAALTRWMAS
jgi:GMP synthase (glutamine-hydrolysing)